MELEELIKIIHEGERLRRKKDNAIVRHTQNISSFSEAYGSHYILQASEEYEKFIMKHRSYVLTFPEDVVKRVCLEASRKQDI